MAALSIAAARAPWLSMTTDSLSVLAFAASGTALIVTAAEADGPRVAALRRACALLAALLIGASTLHWLSQWALALSCGRRTTRRRNDTIADEARPEDRAA